MPTTRPDATLPPASPPQPSDVVEHWLDDALSDSFPASDPIALYRGAFHPD